MASIRPEISVPPSNLPTPPTQLLARIRSEYLEMPGMRLTLMQARRLWGIDILMCSGALSALEATGFLTRTREGAYVLSTAERRTA
jgi:predicted transcriptional regulator of viral defense system